MEGQSFLLQFFDAFFAEVVRQKRRALLSKQRPDLSQVEQGDAVSLQVESMAAALQDVLSKQHFHVLHHGGDYALSLYREVQYAMVALADELMLSMAWPGQKLWEDAILEQRVFNSHVAGEVIYDRIEQLIGQKDPERADIAKVYLLILGLGFKGKYGDDVAQVNGVKRRLFLFIHHYQQRLKEDDFTLFPSAYGDVLEDGIVHQLPNARAWHTLLYASVLLVFVVSYGFWFHSTREVHAVAKQIIQISGVDTQ